MKLGIVVHAPFFYICNRVKKRTLSDISMYPYKTL